MDSAGSGGITFNRGNANGSKYVIKPNMSNKPVIYVSWFDCARYCNWLHNGKQIYSTTDEAANARNTGAYNVGTAVTGNAVARESDATYYIPTENQWYKAAYYKGGSTNAGYWRYATQSDSDPTPVTADSFGNGSARVSDYVCIIGVDPPIVDPPIVDPPIVDPPIVNPPVNPPSDDDQEWILPIEGPCDGLCDVGDNLCCPCGWILRNGICVIDLLIPENETIPIPEREDCSTIEETIIVPVSNNSWYKHHWDQYLTEKHNSKAPTERGTIDTWSGYIEHETFFPRNNYLLLQGIVSVNKLYTPYYESSPVELGEAADSPDDRLVNHLQREYTYSTATYYARKTMSNCCPPKKIEFLVPLVWSAVMDNTFPISLSEEEDLNNQEGYFAPTSEFYETIKSILCADPPQTIVGYNFPSNIDNNNESPKLSFEVTTVTNYDECRSQIKERNLDAKCNFTNYKCSMTMYIARERHNEFQRVQRSNPDDPVKFTSYSQLIFNPLSLDHLWQFYI